MGRNSGTTRQARQNQAKEIRTLQKEISIQKGVVARAYRNYVINRIDTSWNEGYRRADEAGKRALEQKELEATNKYSH